MYKIPEKKKTSPLILKSFEKQRVPYESLKIIIGGIPHNNYCVRVNGISLETNYLPLLQ